MTVYIYIYIYICKEEWRYDRAVFSIR